VKGYYSTEMFSKKILCGLCGHFFEPYKAKETSLWKRLMGRSWLRRLLRR
jgi:hypothetical protein